MTSVSSISPVQIWIGSDEHVMSELYSWLEKKWCLSGGCGICISCKQIRSHQHYGAVWIEPNRYYKTEQIEEIIHRMSFVLDDNEKVVFILQKADLLNHICANMLLKSLEEPPRGYQFILIAPTKESLIPTIQSRAIIRYFSHEKLLESNHELFLLFTKNESMPAAYYMRLIDQLSINEHKTKQIFDQICVFWLAQYKEAIASNNYSLITELEEKIKICKVAHSQLPSMGSSRIFWLNFFLMFYAG